MYIAPNTNIRLLRNCPLDNTYRNTIYFASASAQAAYFSGLTKYNLVNYSYQRYQKGIRVGIEADNLYDCNYVMFQNSAFGNKWFYAFITSVEYVNNETSYVEFELDVMQTWAFDYVVDPSFVEREHPNTDNYFENLVPENLEHGEYICRSMDNSGHLGALSIVLACTFDEDYQDATGGKYGNIYSGLHFNTFSSASAANTFIAGAVENNLADGIVSCFMMPTDFIAGLNESAQTYNIQITQNKLDIDGYVPRNKKLFN